MVQARVAKNEGLRSPQAIAFIRAECSRNLVSLRRMSYLRIDASSKNVTEVLQQKNQTENTLNVSLGKNIGESKWTN